ncbi:MAG TPA: RT0821/Lpp0805 family surface protein [Stellaceae bacterium]|jgi:surface antigen|nr:RT0821/Lpp0805 family surface protein [Stellaceae bacterium]
MQVFGQINSCGTVGARAIAVAALALTVLHAGAARAQNNYYGTDQRYCDRSAINQILSPTTGNVVGSLGGAAAGGLLGNQVGKSSGKTAATIIGVLGGALAGGYIGRSMDPVDRGCVTQSLDHAPANQPVAWQNPNTGSSYWVTPTRDLRGPHNEPCREYVTDAVITGQRQNVTHVACERADGSWVPVAANQVRAAAPAPAPARAPQAQTPAPQAISSDMVFKVQQRLRDLGFYVRDNIDGKWGPATATSLRNFQRSRQLDATGQLDSRTMAALELH